MQKMVNLEDSLVFLNREEIEEIKYRLSGKTILFVSSLTGEGKTSIAIAVGKSLSETQKVLYIGALSKDLCKVKESDTDNKICCSNYKNLFVLFKEYITCEDVEKYRQDFDYILVEANALEISKNALAFANLCDQIILITEANRCSYRMVKENIELLNDVHAKKINLVINRAKKNYGVFRRKK